MVDSVFSSSDICLKIFYNKRSTKIFIVHFVTKCLEFMPAYTFSMAFGLVATRASQRFNFSTLSWVPGDKYSTADYYASHKYTINSLNDEFFAPSCYYMMQHMYIEIVVIFSIWWYLDHVLASNRGVAYNFLFMFQKDYWKSCMPQK